MTDRDVLITIAKGVGEVKGEIKGVSQRMKSIEANCIMCNDQIHQMNARLACHDQDLMRHDKKISDLFRKVELTEDTGITYITQQKAKWSTLKIIGSIAISVGSLVGVLIAAIKLFSK